MRKLAPLVMKYYLKVDEPHVHWREVNSVEKDKKDVPIQVCIFLSGCPERMIFLPAPF